MFPPACNPLFSWDCVPSSYAMRTSSRTQYDRSQAESSGELPEFEHGHGGIRGYYELLP